MSKHQEARSLSRRLFAIRPGPRRVALGILQLVAGAAVLVVLAGMARRMLPEPALSPGWVVIRPPHEVSAVALLGNAVWAGGRDGLVVVDRRTARVLPSPRGEPGLRYVTDLLVDRQGRLWIAHRDGLTSYGGGEWKRYTEGPLPGPATALLEDRDGSLWVGGETGVARYDGQSWRVFTTRDGLGFPAVDVIFQDRDGTMWFGSASPTQGGLTRYDGATWRAYSTRDGLVHNSVNAIVQDRTGALWVATGFANLGGTNRLADETWSSLTRRDGLAGEKVRSIFEDREGWLWFGSEYDGIAVYDGKGWSVFTPRDGLAGWEVKEMVQDDDGVYWLGTEDGLSRVEPSATKGVR